jgi:hypothetical protein
MTNLPPPRKLGGAGGAPGAGGPRPARPAMKPPPPSGGSMMLRKMLMLFIIFACLGLGGAIAYKLWRAAHPVERSVIDVKDQFEKALDQAKDASKAILSVQTKVWGRGEELKPDDFEGIKKSLGELRDAHDKMKDLLDLLHARNLDDSKEKQDIVPKWLQCKMWILDASDLLDNQKPPEYGGLNIPMFLTSDKIRKATTALGEIRTESEKIIERNNPDEIKATRKKISDLREQFRGFVTKMQDLDKYVAEGLARPDLTSKEVIELEMLRDDANKAQMAVKAAGRCSRPSRTRRKESRRLPAY